MIANTNIRISEEKFFDEDEAIFDSYDKVSFFLIRKLEQDLPFAKIDYYINIRNLRVVTVSYDDLTIALQLELGYVEFCGIEYDFNLYDIVRLVKAIQYYLLKYTNIDISRYIYIKNPCGW